MRRSSRKITKAVKAPRIAALRLQCLTTIATELELQKANNKGKVPYGALARLVQEYKESFPWLNKYMVQNHIRKLSKQQKSGASLRQESGSDNSGISSLLQLSTSSSTKMSSLTNTKNSNTDDNSAADDDDSAATDDDSASANAANSSMNSSNNPPSGVITQSNSIIGGNTLTNKNVGRPKGSTAESSRDLKRRIELATEEAAEMYCQRRKQARASRSRVKKGELTAIIQLCKAKNSIPEKNVIQPECVRTRAKRKTFKGGISGNTSPMIDIEPYLVELIGELEKMRVPISCRQGLALANSIISGTSHESRVIAWKQKHCNSFNRSDSSEEPLLGKGYWSGFMKRNGHLVKEPTGALTRILRTCTARSTKKWFNLALHRS